MLADTRLPVDPAAEPSGGPASWPTDIPAEPTSRRDLSADECRAVLEHVAFGHLAFARRAHVDAVPIRFVLVGSWLYFRASAHLRHDIARNRWALIASTDAGDATHLASVVVRGACYSAEETGSAASDAVALNGIIRLRNSAGTAATRKPHIERRTQTVFRMHVDTLCGYADFVPEHVVFEGPASVRNTDVSIPWSTGG